MHSPRINTQPRVGSRNAPFGVVAAAALFLITSLGVLPQSAAAQVPGMIATITELEPVVEVIVDPVTLSSETFTTRETIIDVKHEDNLQFNQCMGGEPVLLNGNQKFTIKMSTSTSGKFHDQTHQISNGTGEACQTTGGPFPAPDCSSFTGQHYSFASMIQSVTTGTGTAPSMFNWEEHLVRASETSGTTEVATGDGDDWFVKFVIHQNNGVTTVEKVEFFCR